MHLIEKILCKVLPYVDITDHDTGEVYLRRWFIYPRRPENNKNIGRLYLHKFYNGDNSRDPHDHPWPFRSLILKGGYYEHRLNPRYRPDGYYSKTTRKWYGPWSVLKRGARWVHAVEIIPGQPAWTLFHTGPKERHWGFHTKDGWCWHRNYKNGICWCFDDPNAKVKGEK